MNDRASNRKDHRMYVYIQSEPALWTVGFYGPDGKFEPESDHDSTKEAAGRVAYLNGGQGGGAYATTAEHRQLQDQVIALAEQIAALAGRTAELTGYVTQLANAAAGR
jgi:hypothetical protein